jgi:hypothetical protein
MISKIPWIFGLDSILLSESDNHYGCRLLLTMKKRIPEHNLVESGLYLEIVCHANTVFF